ncbi:MAG: helix-turn-helix domain-containing protein [Myxococcota bacterium]|nr:helix-turn-helix domain-containing protein [Myxococcota bacterium]
MGLRERKKARLRASILATAVDLASRRGFDALRVRDLIDQLEISEATFFNYFSSKSELLDAWLADELANAFAQLAGESRNRRSTLRQRVRQLARVAANAEGLAAAAWQRGRLQRAAGAAAARSDLAALLAASRDAGELRRDIEPVELAELLVASVGLAIAVALGSGDPRPEARALRAADLVLDGARRRHERVRLGSQPAPPPVRPA